MKIWKYFGIAGILMLSAALKSADVFAVEATRIRDNLSSAQDITIRKIITDVTNPVVVGARYKLIPNSDNPAPVGNLSSFYEIDFDTATPYNNQAELVGYLDLGNLSFSKVGDYRFTLKEHNTTDTTTYPADKDSTYDIFVYVRNEVDDNNVPTGNLVATMPSYIMREGEAEKMSEAVFVTRANFSYIKVRSSVSGNMADPDKYFRYKINLTGAANGDRFVVTGQDNEIVYGGEALAPSSELVAGADDNYVYLKHGQEVTIGIANGVKQLPIGITYTIDSDDQENYISYVDEATALVSSEKTIQAVPSANAHQSTKERFAAQNETNLRHDYNGGLDGAVLTGVSSRAVPFLAVAGAACVGLVLTGKKIKQK